MGFLRAIKPALQAIEVGKELNNAKAWKNVQTVALLLSSMLSIATAFGVDVGITSEQVLGVAGAIAAIAAYFVPATSARYGIGSGPGVVVSAPGVPAASQPMRLDGGSDSQPVNSSGAFSGDH